MTNYAAVKYMPAPTKRQLIARIERGEVLKDHEAMIAADFGLGRITRKMHMGIVLTPWGEHASVVLARARQQEQP
jgi:hypothetical protein